MIINLVTFNMWDDPYLRKERLEWFINTILKSKPDILFLQGVTKFNILHLSEALVGNNYIFITNTQDRSSFEVIATRWKIGDWKFNKFSTTKSNTGLLWGYIEIDNKRVALATSQLDYDRSNIGQLNCALKFLNEKFDHCITGIDTRISGEDLQLPSDWNDAWIATGKNDFCKFTLDYKRNTNLYQKEELRSDRIFYKGGLKPIAFNLFGTDKVCGTTKKTQPSNHFGLQFSFIL